MQNEVEAKFLNVDHAALRILLAELSAELVHPMRLMRRVVFDLPARSGESRARLRVRDEGDKVTVTYKSQGAGLYANEVETTVGSYDAMSEILQAAGLGEAVFQESRRETWQYYDVEVVLDEWPWAQPYIEIEGPDEPAIQAVAKQLGFEWKDAAFGPPETVYRREYPGMTADDTLNSMPELRFDGERPAWLAARAA